MTTEDTLLARADSKCELCDADGDLSAYQVPPSADGGADACVLTCGECRDRIENPDANDVHYWRCLSDSMWTQVPAVQVVAWRILKRLANESWARDLLGMLYLDDETQTWAEADGVDAGMTDIPAMGSTDAMKKQPSIF